MYKAHAVHLGGPAVHQLVRGGEKYMLYYAILDYTMI